MSNVEQIAHIARPQSIFLAEEDCSCGRARSAVRKTKESPDGTAYPSLWFGKDRGSLSGNGATPRLVDHGAHLPALPAGVPRRFGLGKLMAITALFAGLFGLMTWLGTPPVVFTAIAIFFAGIGLSQMLLFGGKAPRRSSVSAGLVLCPLISLAASFAMYWPEIDIANILRGDIEAFGPCAIIGLIGVVATLFGGGLGYMAGCLIAGIFLGGQLESEETEEHRAEPVYPPLSDRPTDVPVEPPGA